MLVKTFTPWIAVAALSATGLAHAHAHLRSSTPANHSTLTAAPKMVTLEFQEPVQLTALSIGKGGKIEKIAPLPAPASKTFALPLPVIDAGTYVITWRAVSGDGHVMSATIEFSVQPAAK
jgi:methionine-rich copper-binding protein CopC